jgi:hypothetical protein
VREPEEKKSSPPGRPRKRAWSKHPDLHIRNAEAEGSNPFTSTKAQFRGLKWDPPEGHESRLSATGFVVEVEDASWPHSPKNQVSGSPSRWEGATGRACRYVPLSTKSGSSETDEIGMSRASPERRGSSPMERVSAGTERRILRSQLGMLERTWRSSARRSGPCRTVTSSGRGDCCLPAIAPLGQSE